MDNTRTTIDGDVGRDVASAADARTAQEIRRLRAKAREAADVSPAARSHTSQGRRSPKVPIAVLLVLIAVAAGVWWRFPSVSGQMRSSLSPVVTRASQGIAQALNSAGQLIGVPAGQQAPDASDSVPPPPKPALHAATYTRKTEGGGPSSPDPTPTVSSDDAPERIVPTTGEAVPEPSLLMAAELPAAMIENPDPEPGRIYSSLDPGVTPPVPLETPIGRVTTDPVRRPGDVDILVDSTGIVERLTLLVPNRYQDRFLIYAIKARQFQPAVANGRPVKYLLHIRTNR